MFSRRRRKSSIGRANSNENGLSASLLAGDSLQMATIQPQYQPKSFFNNDEEETKSESTATAAEEETFESVGYGWDIVMIIPIPQQDEIGKLERSHEHDEIIMALHSGGLQTYLYNSTQPNQRICKIRAPLSRLRAQAALLEYIMQYDHEELQNLIETGVQKENGEHLIKPVYIKHDPNITTLNPFEYIHDIYTEETAYLFKKGENLSHPFSAQHRIKLILSIINGKKSEGGCDLHLDDLVKDSSILAYFPHHDKPFIESLEQHWLPWRVMPWEQPIDEIRDYFGEKIGLYFEFLGHYTTWLLPLTIVGVLSSLDVLVEAVVYGSLTAALGRAYTVPAFCTFVAFWAQLMLEYWKRTEATKAMEWGMSEFEEVAKERKNFIGEETTSHINGKKILYFSTIERSKRQRYSGTIITGMVLLVIACVGVIFYLKYYMVVQSNDETVNGLGAMTASILNAVQIQILNQVYHDLAVSLTNQENHRTDTEYEDSLISKLFAFQFVNSYGSFFYIAFIKKGVGDPCQGSCMSELSLALAIIFMTRLFVGNAQEVLIPLAMSWWKRRQDEKALENETPEEKRYRLARESNISKAEFEFTLETYDPLMGTLEDYAELAIQYGYVTLFVAAFPLAPLLAYVSNMVEIRTDGWKLIHAFRRALPFGAQDIGTWMAILQITSVISVITNAGIMCFTMDIFDYSPWGKLWIFIGFQYFIFSLMGLFAYIVEDVPEEVNIQHSRQEFHREKVEQIIQNIPDEEEGIVVNSTAERIQINEADDEFPVLRSNHRN